MTGTRPDLDGPRPASRDDAVTASPTTVGESSGVERLVGLIDRFAWLALLPWGCSVLLVVVLLLGTTLAGWSSR